MTDAISARPRLSLPWRLLLLALLWLVIAGRDPLSWMIGVPSVIAAAWLSGRLPSILAGGAYQPARLAAAASGGPKVTAAGRAGRWSLLGLLRFLPFFVGQSVLGGMDVAARVMRPRVRVTPGLLTYTMRLRDPIAQIAFLNSISLLPGTLSADLNGREITVHALERTIDVAAHLRRLEDRVAALFGERPDERPDGRPDERSGAAMAATGAPGRSRPEEIVTDG